MKTVADYRAMGYKIEEADEAKVAQFVAGAAGMTQEQVLKVIERLESMVARNERAGGVSLSTMEAAATQLRAQAAR